MHGPRLDSVQEHPREIVLLEDADLYRYHVQDHGRASGLPQRVDRTTYGQDSRVESPVHTTSEPSYGAPGSTAGFDRTTTPYGLHATPYSMSLRKPSLTSIDTAAYSNGALRPGGSVELLCRQNVGFLLNWFLVGFFNTSVQAVVYPLLDTYLGYNDVQLNAAFALLKFSFLFKFPAGFLSDCVPIDRQRRKPYIFIGWTLLTLFMIVMVFHSEPQPYQRDGEIINADAASEGVHYVIPLMIGTFAHLLVTVAVEGMMVECAQREGEFIRGRAQSLCLMFRLAGEILGGLSIAFSLNSREYGGTFTTAVPLQILFASQALLAASGIVITKLFFHEERTSTSTQRLATQLRRIWNILQQRTTWQILVFGFCERLGSSYEIQEYRRVYIDWLGANSLTLNIIDGVSSSGVLLATWLFMRFFINSNWRKIVVWSVVTGLVIMVPVDVLVVFGVIRDATVYMGKGHLVAFTDAWLFIVRGVVIVEVAEPGYEAVTYGIFTTVFNLASMVVSMGKNVAAASTDIAETDLKLDTHEVRWHVMHELIFKYVFRLVMALAVLPLLPRQKRHLRERKLLGNSSIVMPLVIFIIFVCLFTISVTSNLLALFESTSCLIIAGGTGC